jgi:hypothetical protein
MRVSNSLMMTAAVVGLVTLGCGPKESREPERRRTTEPERPTGPEEKLMDPETRPKVDAVFKAQRGELERCYNDYVAKSGKTKLRGTVIVAVRIGVTPNPTKVWFLKNTFNEPKLNECFLEKVRAWIFPTWGGWMDYSFPSLILEEL